MQSLITWNEISATERYPKIIKAGFLQHNSTLLNDGRSSKKLTLLNFNPRSIFVEVPEILRENSIYYNAGLFCGMVCLFIYAIHLETACKEKRETFVYYV